MKVHHYSHKIFFADTDQAAVVHHANYLRYFEAARIELLSDIGFPYKKMQNQHMGLAPVDIQIQYLSPLRLEDVYIIHTHCPIINKASLVMDQKLYQKDSLSCHAIIKLACLDEAHYKIVPLERELAQKLAPYSK